MTQAWTPEQTKTEVGEDGDILTVLRRVWTAYVDRSCSLYEKALENAEKGEDIRSTADYYKVQAENIQGVLNQ
jgi:hypothetical protein